MDRRAVVDPWLAEVLKSGEYNSHKSKFTVNCLLFGVSMM